MAERDRLERRRRRLLARQRLELLVLQRALDRAQPVRPLGMARRGEVIEAGGMAEQERGHAVSFRRRYIGHQRRDSPARECPALRTHFTPGSRPCGGGMSSGTKKSSCSGCVGSTRYWSKSVTPSPARNVSSIRKLPREVLRLLEDRVGRVGQDLRRARHAHQRVAAEEVLDRRGGDGGARPQRVDGDPCRATRPQGRARPGSCRTWPSRRRCAGEPFLLHVERRRKHQDMRVCRLLEMRDRVSSTP